MEMKITSNLKTKKGAEQKITSNDLVTMLKNQNYDNRPIYEIIDDTNTHVKPYIDYELYFNDPITKEQTHEYIIQVKKYFCNILNTDNLKFAISESFYDVPDDNNKYKMSFHVVVSNYKINYKSLGSIIKSTCVLLNGVDIKVYGSYQKFRLITTSKTNTNSPLIIIEDEKHKHHFITETTGLEEIEFDAAEIVYLHQVMNTPNECAEDYKRWLMTLANIRAIEKLDEDQKLYLSNLFSMRSKAKYKGQEDVRNYYKKNTFKGHENYLTIEATRKNDKNVVDQIKEFQNEKNKTEYEIHKTEVEKTYFIINQLDMCVSYFDKDNLIVMNDKTAHKFFKPRNWNTGKLQYFIDHWYRDDTRRMYDKIVFNTQLTHHKNELNLFTGFEYDDVKPSKINTDIIYKLMKHVLKDERQFNYVLDWMAWIIQNRKKTLICLILYSNNHGVGKNAITSLFQKLLGSKYCCTLDTIEHLTKNFNGFMENKILCVGDEIICKNRDFYNNLKNAITRETINIEKKNVNSYEINDYCNFMLTTNNYNPVKIEDRDRRITISECNETKLTEAEYSEYFKAIENEDILCQIFHDLKDRKVPKQMKVLDTNHKRDLQTYYMPSIYKILVKRQLEFNNEIVGTADLFDDCKRYQSNNKHTDVTCMREMIQLIKRLSDDYEPKRYRIDNDRIRGIKFTNLIEKLNNILPTSTQAEDEEEEIIITKHEEKKNAFFI